MYKIKTGAISSFLMCCEFVWVKISKVDDAWHKHWNTKIMVLITLNIKWQNNFRKHCVIQTGQVEILSHGSELIWLWEDGEDIIA